MRNRKEIAEGVNTTSSMDWERMLLCVLHHPKDAETHSHLENDACQWGSGGWRQKPASHQEYCSDEVAAMYKKHIIIHIQQSALKPALACGDRQCAFD